MLLTIHPLTPERAADYFDFFENRAFTDGSPYRCYCQMYQLSAAESKAIYDSVPGEQLGAVSRRVAEEQIKNGVLRGYLAYDGNTAIGWCNANDRAHYPAEPCTDGFFHLPEAGREMAVVCFEIAPEYRGMGVATALLRQVIGDASASGYAAVVSFPILRTERFIWDHAGPVRLYEKAGFIRAETRGNTAVMRLQLR